MMEAKRLLSAPLPFVGQKRMFAREFAKVLGQYPDDTVFVDLFGGSGLLSHIAKRHKPLARVVYNDFDNYRQRLASIPATNALLADIRVFAQGVPRHKPIEGRARKLVFERLEQELQIHGYLDFITISPSLLFPMRYASSVEDMRRQTIYNNVRRNDYPSCSDYLHGVEVVSCDYRELFDRYKDVPNVVFLVDPPYLSTEAGTYDMYWRLPDYLDVLDVLEGHPFVYFTSNKSSIVDLCEWLAHNRGQRNPFAGCQKVEVHAPMNYNARYIDMMFYTNPEARASC